MIYLHPLLRRLCVAAAMIVLCCLDITAQVTEPFTVRDSIEMTTFSDPFTRTPGAEAREAPDGSAFVVVTTRGLLQTNELESSMWLFEKAPLETFLRKSSGDPPRARLLYRKRGVPEATQSNSYGSLITNVQWSQDSHSLLALVEMKGGIHHLLRIAVRTGRSIDLTSSNRQDIRAISATASTVSFIQKAVAPTVAPQAEKAEIPRTGQSIAHILFPSAYPERQPVGTTWLLRCLSTRPDIQGCRQSAKLSYPAAAAITFTPALSPDGTKLISAIPAISIPSEWSAYSTADSTYHFDQIPASVDRSGKAFDWPWQYALVDLRTGRTQRLFDAPVAWTASYAGAVQAHWSTDMRRVLLTNTFLPTKGDMPSLPYSVKPCAIAVYEVATGNSTCVMSTPFPEQRRYVSDADFIENGARIKATWRDSTGLHREIYTERGNVWSQVQQASPDREALRLVIHQDMAVPPTLWVEAGEQHRLLLDPNPQLSTRSLARGQLYEWKDESGHRWRGGLLIPSTPKPASGYPLVIQTHGFYNEHEFMPDGAFTTGTAAQPLACAGIAVLQMEDRPDKHTRPANQEADDAVHGFIGAIDALKSDGLIDDQKVGIVGFSRTHWYVERALEEAPQRFQAATMIDGVDQSYVTDMLFAVDYPMAIREHESAIGARPFGTGLPQWLASASGFNLDKITAAVRLEAITPMSVLGEWETYSGLRQLGKPVDLVEIPNGQHILQKPQERYASQQGDVDWFRFWLQGYERNDAEDNSQYGRWKGALQPSK